MPLYTADTLMTLRTITAPAGKPDWANLVADVHDRAVPPELCGPGLYALFLDGALFYIGLHVGEQAGAGYPVLHRWVLHVVGQTMRSPRISFSRASLRRLLDAQTSDPVTEGIAACLPQGRETDLDALGAHPLLAGPHCTAQKALFAARHWTVFGPGNEKAMLSRIECLFQPVAADWSARLDGAEGRERGAWAREEWLRPAETRLVNRFRPICNAAIPLGDHRDGIAADEVAAAMAAELPQVLSPFDRAAFSARIAARRPASASLVEAYGSDAGTPIDPEVADIADEEGLSVSEQEFRRRSGRDGMLFVDRLRDQCPPSIEPYFTDVPDLRLRIAGERRPLVVLTTTRGRFRCWTRASVEACRRLGFADATSAGRDAMPTGFYIDPATTSPGAILALVGAALTA